MKLNPCTDCGNEFHPVCMDFDHVKGEKKFNISKAAQLPITTDDLLDEIDKCELVCSNCHRLRTYYRICDTRMRDDYLNFMDTPLLTD